MHFTCPASHFWEFQRSVCARDQFERRLLSPTMPRKVSQQAASPAGGGWGRSRMGVQETGSLQGECASFLKSLENSLPDSSRVSTAICALLSFPEFLQERLPWNCHFGLSQFWKSLDSYEEECLADMIHMLKFSLGQTRVISNTGVSLSSSLLPSSLLSPSFLPSFMPLSFSFLPSFCLNQHLPLLQE